MALNEIGYTGQPPVTGYGPGFFRVGGRVIEGEKMSADIAAVSLAGPWRIGASGPS